MRAIWKGSISFSLVNIPISFYPATTGAELKFHLLRKSDLSPIKYQRVAEADGKEVEWKEIVKGYEYEKGKFVIIDEKDFERADVKATQTVEITEFVPLAEIDPMFFDRPYYLEPQKRGEKAYALLRDALQRSGLVGIAKVVLKTRQHLAAVKPEQKALILELMHFSEELVKPSALQIPGQLELGKKELEMAGELIERMTDHFDAARYTDDYRHALLQRIEQKIKLGGRAPAEAAPVGQPSPKVIDLVSVLQQSLAQAKETKKTARASRSSRRGEKKAYRKAA